MDNAGIEVERVPEGVQITMRAGQKFARMTITEAHAQKLAAQLMMSSIGVDVAKQPSIGGVQL